MITLATELSTSHGELALLDDDRLLVERRWTEDRDHRQQIFAEMEALVASGELDLGKVGLLAVGVGPGAFSGLRMAISAPRAMALPGGTPVFGVASAEALACEILDDARVESVAIFGDARRQELWMGRFRRAEGGLIRREGDWWVAAPDALPPDRSGLGAVWVTPDWERIGMRLKELCPEGTALIEESRRPTARYIGRLAAAKRRAGWASEPLAPIYLHPAVSVLPTF